MLLLVFHEPDQPTLRRNLYKKIIFFGADTTDDEDFLTFVFSLLALLHFLNTSIESSNMQCNFR